MRESDNFEESFGEIESMLNRGIGMLLVPSTKDALVKEAMVTLNSANFKLGELWNDLSEKNQPLADAERELVDAVMAWFDRDGYLGPVRVTKALIRLAEIRREGGDGDH